MITAVTVAMIIMPATPADQCAQLQRGSTEWYSCVATSLHPTAPPAPASGATITGTP